MKKEPTTEIRVLKITTIKERYDMFLEAKDKMEKELDGKLTNARVLEYLCEFYLRQ